MLSDLHMRKMSLAHPPPLHQPSDCSALKGGNAAEAEAEAGEGGGANEDDNSRHHFKPLQGAEYFISMSLC